MSATVVPFALAPVTALIGPSGSGKTELALALALLSARQRAADPSLPQVALADLDVLKPYFRSREARDELAEAGVELIAPPGALAQSDLPILAPALRGALARRDAKVLLDVGGDPPGARALGSVCDLVATGTYDVLLVLNRCRPFMASAAQVVATAHQLAEAAQLRVTGIASNANLGDETTERDALWGLELALEVAAALAVPVRLLGIGAHLEPAFAGRVDVPQCIVLRRRMIPSFLGGPVLAPPSRRPGGDAS